MARFVPPEAATLAVVPALGGDDDADARAAGARVEDAVASGSARSHAEAANETAASASAAARRISPRSRR
jgi:hypothetical protein